MTTASEPAGAAAAAGSQAAHSALGWGSQSEMGALDVVMWRAESDPTLRSTVLALDILDEAPDWDRYVKAHEWATRMVPRFRQHVVSPLLGLGQPLWVADPTFDLSYHVRRTRLSEPTYTSLLEAVQNLAMTPFDRSRAPWETVLYEGLPDGKAAYVLKMHHSMTDGLSAVQLLSALHSRRREPSPDKPQPTVPVPETPSESGQLARQTVRDIGAAARAGRRLAGSLGSLRRPDRALRDVARLAGSLQRVLGDPPAPPSPLLRSRSMSWRFHALDVRFDDLRAVSKPNGCSLNDAFLAGLLGAIRLYHESHGCPVDAIPTSIPVSVRRPGEADGGNRIVAARLAGPVSVVDPLARMHQINLQIRAARQEPAAEVASTLAPILAWLPGPLIAAAAGPTTKLIDLQASNIPGLREDVYLAGSRIERSYPFGPLPGCAAMVTMLSHGEYCCIGANIDAAAFTDSAEFGRCLEEGFNELLSLHPGAAPAVRRV